MQILDDGTDAGRVSRYVPIEWLSLLEQSTFFNGPVTVNLQMVRMEVQTDGNYFLTGCCEGISKGFLPEHDN